MNPNRFEFLKFKKTKFLLSSALFLCALTGFYFFYLAPKQAEKSGALWRIVSLYCDKNPHHKPCLSYHPENDYVLLKDLVGKAQILLIPISRLHGIESRRLGKAEAPNYFQSAWAERHLISEILKHPVADREISLSINSRFARSQNQLHIHISCLKTSVAEQLQALNPANLPKEISLQGNPYQIRLANSLTPSPFLILNQKEHFNKKRMANKTLVVTAAPDNRFYILTGETNLFHLNWGSGESLQNHDCSRD